jgi:hypothetical protein
VTIGSSNPRSVGVGGSSGSGCVSGSLSKPVRPDSRVLLDCGLRRSSSASGPGGGSGLGFGLIGDRRGRVERPPPNFLAKDIELEGPEIPSLAGTCLPGCFSSMISSSRCCILGARLVSSWMLDRAGTGVVFSSVPPSVAPGGCLRLRISGLCRAKLALVGDANDGRFFLERRGDDVVSALVAAVGVGADLDADLEVDCAGESTVAAVLADVLRRFRAGSSISQLLC